jgi:hypothetical protein
VKCEEKVGQRKKVNSNRERMWRKKWTATGKINEEKDDSNKESLQKKLAAKEKVCSKKLAEKEKFCSKK